MMSHRGLGSIDKPTGPIRSDIDHHGAAERGGRHRSHLETTFGNEFAPLKTSVSELKTMHSLILSAIFDSLADVRA